MWGNPVWKLLEDAGARIGLPVTRSKFKLYDARAGLYLRSIGYDRGVPEFLENVERAEQLVPSLTSPRSAYRNYSAHVLSCILEKEKSVLAAGRSLKVVVLGGGDFLETVSLAIALDSLLPEPARPRSFESWDVRAYCWADRVQRGFAPDELQSGLLAKQLVKYFSIRGPVFALRNPDRLRITAVTRNILGGLPDDIDVVVCLSVLDGMLSEAARQVGGRLLELANFGALVLTDFVDNPLSGEAGGVPYLVTAEAGSFAR